MKVQVGAAVGTDVEIDLATRDDIEKLMKPKRGEIAIGTPIRRKPKGAAAIPNPSALTLIDLGGPPAGRIWDMRHITVCGADPTASPSGKGLVCIGAPVIAATLDPFVVWTSAATLPADTTFSKDQAVILGTEHLFVVISGGTAGAVYAAHAMVFEYISALAEEITA